MRKNLNVTNFLYKFQKKYFPRFLKKDIPPEIQMLEKNAGEEIRIKRKKDIFKEEDSDDLEFDSKFKDFELARLDQGITEIPKKIQSAAQSVFSRHNYQDVKVWTRKYLLNISQNQASEPPLDLSKIKNIPFANSGELDIKLKIFKDEKKIPENNDDKTKNKKDEVKEDKKMTITVEEERKYNKDKDINVNPIKIQYDQAYAVAYLKVKMPYTYLVTEKILQEIKKRQPDFKPTSVLDFGAGLGSGVWAAHDTFTSIDKLAAIEPNKYMRKLGRFVTSSIDKEILWVESITMIPGTGIERGKFDIIILSHVLQEAPSAKLRQMIIDTLWNRLANDGMFIVIEPGTPKGFRYIHDLREFFRAKSREEASFVAPCPHHERCPIADKPRTWCHFSNLSHGYEKQVFPKRNKEKDIHNEKYSYLVTKKGKTPNVELNSEEEAKTVEEKSFFWDRIILPIIKKHRHLVMDVCSHKGLALRKIVSKSHGTEGGYKSAKRMKWGDLWYLKARLPNKFRKEYRKGKRLW